MRGWSGAAGTRTARTVQVRRRIYKRSKISRPVLHWSRASRAIRARVVSPRRAPTPPTQSDHCLYCRPSGLVRYASTVLGRRFIALPRRVLAVITLSRGRKGAITTAVTTERLASPSPAQPWRSHFQSSPPRPSQGTAAGKCREWQARAGLSTSEESPPPRPPSRPSPSHGEPPAIVCLLSCRQLQIFHISLKFK